MRINKLDNIYQIYNKNLGKKKIKPEHTTKDTDEIKISEKAMEYQFALQKLKNVDDVRMDKVQTIKKQIENGTYEVDSKKIAEKILQQINFDKKI